MVTQLIQFEKSYQGRKKEAKLLERLVNIEETYLVFIKINLIGTISEQSRLKILKTLDIKEELQDT
jgi:hypothetical protein